MAEFKVNNIKLEGPTNIFAAEKIFYMNQSNVKLKQIEIAMDNESITLEAGALHYMVGKIEATNKMPSVGSFIKSKLTKESIFRPQYKGTGKVFLEPSFGFFLIHDLQDGEELIVDKGIYYASESSVKISVEMQKNISSTLFGGEGLFQTKIKGSGKVVLNSPVPKDEIVKIQLNDEKLSVDGNFAILRKGNIKFKAELSSKSIFGSAFTGEGLLQTFTGSGEVWLAPGLNP
jgi:uncharacterized protein (AIM24 family)